MDWVNRSLQWVVFSNSWIAIGAGCITYYFSFKCLGTSGHQIDLYAVFVAILTFTSYNFQRLIKLKNKDTPSSIRHFWINDRTILLGYLTIIGAIFSAFFAFYLLTFQAVLFSIPIGIFVLFYAQVIPLFKGIRSVPVLKNIITALVWMYAILVVPILLANKNNVSFEIVSNYGFVLTALFLFIFGVSIPFDIRDVEQDKGKIKTLVGIIGINNSKILALLCFVGSLVIAFSLGLIVFMLCSLLAILLLLFTHINRSELFFSLLWDGIMLCFGVGLFIENMP